MKLVAEYVSRGHPDRLCDAIVDSIVDNVVQKDSDALCGLECAVFDNKVFLTGRIAAGKEEVVINELEIKLLVQGVYSMAGYGDKKWHPYPKELEIYQNVCIETLKDDERELRKYSDDQNIVTGYANNDFGSLNLPFEQYLILSIGYNLQEELSKKGFGPDYKILGEIDYENGEYSWDRLTISVEHNYKVQKDYSYIYKDVKETIINVLNDPFLNCPDSIRNIDPLKIYVNGAGDFIIGGPNGDNGLSGKKLVVDFYGPRIPIGGGAICGKDPHKIDYCGAIAARELALNLVEKYNYKEVHTRLAWSPGEEEPYLIEAYEVDDFGISRKIDDKLLPPSDNFKIENIVNRLSLCNKAKHLSVHSLYYSYMNLFRKNLGILTI